MTTSVPVPALDRDLIGRLRADVIASEWTVENLQTLISEGALSALMRDSRLPALVELAGATDPAAVLTRFFILGLPERASALNEALPTLGAHGLESLASRPLSTRPRPPPLSSCPVRAARPSANQG